jgi:uncharacterized protein YggT (Ycf19 family)
VVERRVVDRPVAAHGVDTVVTGPSTGTLLRRIVTLLFGILQVLIVLRIVLLLLAANQDNSIVSFILGATDPFVEPFRGIFDLDTVRGRTGSIFDVGAIVALVGWTLVEALVLAIVGLVDRRREVVA